jgi:hypothetical protein
VLVSKRSDWPRCRRPKRDGTPCGSAVITGPDGKPAETCAPHAPKLEEVPAEEIAADAEPTPEPTAAPTSTAVESLRDALRDAVSTEEVAALMQRVLMDALEASKETWATCPHCHKRHPVNLPDLGVRAQAVRSLIESLEGRLREQTDAEQRQLDRKAELLTKQRSEMTDAELARRIVQLKEERARLGESAS